MKSVFPLPIVSLLLLTAVNAEAHLTLTNPPPRDPNSDLKYGPCGELGSERTTDPERISTFAPGETITVEWIEVVDHDPAHYRILFSKEGTTEFFDPTGYDDIRSGYPVLLDGIADADAGQDELYSVQVTLPTEPCDNCTLQVIQVMHDKQPWGGGNDIYYQCADIVIAGEPVVVPPLGTGGSDDTPDGAGGTLDPASGGTGGSSTVPAGSGGDSTTTPMLGDEETDPSSSDTGGCSVASPRSNSGWLSALSVLLMTTLVLRRRRNL